MTLKYNGLAAKRAWVTFLALKNTSPFLTRSTDLIRPILLLFVCRLIIIIIIVIIIITGNSLMS